MKQYIHYGCGLTAPEQWENFDVSPTLRIQKVPVLGALLSTQLNVRFPSNVRYGNIVTGLPVENDSSDGIFCSHVLEHLALMDFQKALANTYAMLKPGGIFRCVVPDLEYAARSYVRALDKGEDSASIEFMSWTLLGVEKRPKGLKGILSNIWGNTHHLWMWDHKSLAKELEKAGFTQIRRCNLNDCEDPMFNLVEEAHRFENAVALEARK